MWSFMSALLATGFFGLDTTTLIWAGVIMAQIVINIFVLVTIAVQSSKGKKKDKTAESERAKHDKELAELKKDIGDLSEKISNIKLEPSADEGDKNSEVKEDIADLKRDIGMLSEKVNGLIPIPLPEPEPLKEEPKLAILTFKEGTSVVLSVPETDGEDTYNEEDYIWYINGEQKIKGRVLRAEEGFTEGEYQVRVCCNDEPVNLFKLIIEHEEKIEEVAFTATEPQKVVRKPVVIDEDSASGTLRYNRSFTARMIQSEDSVKQWYTLIKNELLNYNKVKARMSWKKETFRVSGSAIAGGGEAQTVARLSHRGKTLCLFLPLDPKDYEDSKYKIESAGTKGSYAETPCLYRIKNEKRMRYALELIDAVMEKLGVKRVDRPSEDFFFPYEGTVELIEKGLIKRVIKSKEDEAIFEKKD